MLDRNITLALENYNNFLTEAEKILSIKLPKPELAHGVQNLSPEQILEKIEYYVSKILIKDGNINNYPRVIVDTFRHKFTNYEIIRNNITSQRNSDLKKEIIQKKRIFNPCDENYVLSEMVHKIYDLVEPLIEKLLTINQTPQNATSKFITIKTPEGNTIGNYSMHLILKLMDRNNKEITKLVERSKIKLENDKWKRDSLATLQNQNDTDTDNNNQPCTEIDYIHPPKEE